MDILRRLFGRRKSSKEMAKERLRLVLVHDRSGIPPELLHIMKNDIITVISKHVRLDRDGIEVHLSHDHGVTRLVADIPILSARHQPSSGPIGTRPARGARQ
jgi:cell division topological specificity factor